MKPPPPSWMAHAPRRLAAHSHVHPRRTTVRDALCAASRVASAGATTLGHCTTIHGRRGAPQPLRLALHMPPGREEQEPASW